MSTPPLLQHLDAFIGFARSRTADLVQECLMKALKADNVSEAAEGVVIWFYRVLRHAIIAAAPRGIRPWKSSCMSCRRHWRLRTKEHSASA